MVRIPQVFGAGALAAGATLVLTGAAHGNVLTNGDFESDPFDSGWVNETGSDSQPIAVEVGGIVPGSTTAAQIRSGVGVELFTQSLANPTAGDWAFEVFFNAPQPTSDRTFNIAILHEDPSEASIVGTATTQGRINLRLTPGGEVHVFNTTNAEEAYHIGAWQTVMTGVSFGTNHRLHIAGDYDSENPSYTLTLEEVGVESQSVSGLDHWQYYDPGYAPEGEPISNRGVWAVTFISNNNDSAYTIDNISLVPEPASALLIAAAAPLLLRGRRHATRA